MSENDYKVSFVTSPIGRRSVDKEGSAISGVRLDPFRAYSKIPELLQKFIDENDNHAWASIMDKIDYIYENLDHALSSLNRETAFGCKVQSEIKSGKKLLFKPNFVDPQIIGVTHGEGTGAITNTEWPFIASVMRWFHDKLNISYSQMAFAEASCTALILSIFYSESEGKIITTEAVFEGRSGNFYGGGGFYFVRRYLQEHHPITHSDNPMNGYDESVNGEFFPPGSAGNRLMVYDLNKADDKLKTARTISVPDGANFKQVTLHKIIIGGDPQDNNDIREYPGCVLVNLPKLKMHAQDLITNAIKNIGIGLYPVNKYEIPNTEYPSLRTKLPHSPWVFEIDEDTHMPVRNENGEYIISKTAGMPGTQSDVIKAVQSQNVFMLHITDTINMINISHNADARATRIPEGYIWSSLDCVALDLFCARYCFKTLPMLHGMELKKERNLPTEFMRHVPAAFINGNNIYSGIGLDSPLFRYNLYDYAKMRGIGQLSYYVTGWDSLTKTPLVSVEGHLGRAEDTVFTELMTNTLYYNYNMVLHDLQLTILSYAKACDELTGSSLYQEYMELYDENKDGVIDYNEQGRGFETAGLINQADFFPLPVTQAHGDLKQSFVMPAYQMKYANKEWNIQGHDFLKEGLQALKTDTALQLSQADTVRADYFIPQMYFGKGMWPSWQTVTYVLLTNTIYGSQSSLRISLGSMYGAIFQYADIVFHSGKYTSRMKSIKAESPTDQDADQSSAANTETTQDAINRYFNALKQGGALLNFLFYVPKGYGELEGIKIPNVEETDDPSYIFTARFVEIW